MTPLIHVFEHIRRQRKYKRKQLYETARLSADQIRNQIRTTLMPNEYIEPWCEFLDLGIKDYSPLYQHNKRQTLYTQLQVVFGLKDPFLTQILTNIIFFKDKITEWQPIVTAILPATLPHIETLPYEIANVVADISVLTSKEDLLRDDD
jgi:hypothetical protein